MDRFSADFATTRDWNPNMLTGGGREQNRGRVGPKVPEGARLGTGGQAAFLDASQNFQPTDQLRADSHAWRPSEGDIHQRQDRGLFSPVGQRADSRLWDVGPADETPMALRDNSSDEQGLGMQAQALERNVRPQVRR